MGRPASQPGGLFVFRGAGLSPGLQTHRNHSAFSGCERTCLETRPEPDQGLGCFCPD